MPSPSGEGKSACANQEADPSCTRAQVKLTATVSRHWLKISRTTKMKFQSSITTLALALCVLAATGNAYRISMSQVASYWKRAGGSTSSCPTAVAVAWAESRGDVKAKGYNSNSIDRGLWQINNYWHRDVSDSCAFDAGCNARAALRISSGGSRWTPWATYNDGLHHRWMSDARRACGGSSTSSSSSSSSSACRSCLYYGGGRGCASKCPRSSSCQSCINYGGGYGCRTKCSSSSYDEAEEVGGGRVYGEYNNGPVKVGGEWNFDEDEQNVGGFSAYGEYNKGPVKVGGEWNFDEEDESVGSWDQPSHTRPHMPDGNSMGNWINFRL